jgi:hypothetical protein
MGGVKVGCHGIMTYNGHVEKSVVIFDQPAPLAEGTRVRIEVLTESKEGGPAEIPTLANVLRRL